MGVDSTSNEFLSLCLKVDHQIILPTFKRRRLRFQFAFKCCSHCAIVTAIYLLQQMG